MFDLDENSQTLWKRHLLSLLPSQGEDEEWSVFLLNSIAVQRELTRIKSEQVKFLDKYTAYFL